MAETLSGITENLYLTKVRNMSSGQKRTTYRILIRLTGIILLAIILVRIDYREVAVSFRLVKIIPYLSTFLIILPIYLFKAIRWKYLLSLSGIHYAFRDAFLAFFSANFIAFITPGRLGEVMKAFYVKADKDVPLGAAIPSVVIDRIFDMYFLILIACGGLFRFELLHGSFSFALILAFLIIFPVVILNKTWMMPVIIRLFSYQIFRRYSHRIIPFFQEFYEGISGMLDLRLLLGLLWTILAYAFLFLATWVISLSMGLHIDLFTLAIIISIVNVLSFLPVTIGGLGVREVTVIYFFHLLGIPQETAIVFSTLFFFTFYIAGGLFGFICYNLKPLEKQVWGNPR